MSDSDTKTLNEVLSTMINKYVKIGTKGGFIFCGYIRDNYKDMITDISKIKANQIQEFIRKAEEDNATIVNKFQEKKTIFNQNDIDYQIHYNDQKIEKYKAQYEEALVLLDSPVSSIYRSTIDKAIIVIVKSSINGSSSITSRTDMLKYPLYKSIVSKYNI